MPNGPKCATPAELRELMLSARNEQPGITEVIARLSALRDGTQSAEIRELTICMAGMCFAILDLEGEIEELGTAEA